MRKTSECERVLTACAHGKESHLAWEQDAPRELSGAEFLTESCHRCTDLQPEGLLRPR